MAGKSTISITFKLDGDGSGFKKLANDADGFKKAISSTLSEAQKFNTKSINFAAISTGINQASNSINQLMGTLSGLTEGYQNAKQAQTQLVTVMRQRMDANDADVKSINDVIKAQMALGIIGGTVQKRGAQQIATFLTQKGSLETLIPAMNNLIAQQKGINATQEDAYTVGNLMGKAMQGQMMALRRVGITFTEAQKSVMEYGDESQRAAMLAQIITDNVGNMNAELGKTDIGKQKQLENKIAGIKNQIGSVAQAIMPYLSAATSITVLTANAANAANAIKLLGAAFISFTVKSKLASAAMYLYRNAALTVTATTRVLQAAFTGGAIGATTLKVALRGLMISTGIGAAIAGVTMLIEYFANKSDEASKSAESAADGIDTVAEASKRANQTYQNTQAETYSALLTKYKELQAAWKNLTDKQSKLSWVKNNQSAFADLGIRVRSVSDAEHAFSKNTTAVVNSFIQRAKAAAHLAQLTEEYRTQIDLADKIQTSNDAANARHHVNTGDIVPGGSHTTQGGYENVENDGNWHYTDKGAARQNATKWIANSAQDKANRTALKQSQERTKRLEADIAKDAKNNKPLVMPQPKLKTVKDKDKNKIIEGAKSYKDLSHNLEVYKNRLDAADPSNKKLVDGLRKQIEVTEKAAQAAKDAESGLNTQNPKTIEEVDAAIEKQQELRKKATAKNIAGYDAELKRLYAIRDQIENSGHVEIPTDHIKTYAQLNDEIAYYNDQLNKGDEKVRQWAQAHLNELGKVKKRWDDIQNDLKKPGDISTLNSIEDLDDALSYYGELQKHQSTDEVQNTQRVIDALTAKKNVIQLGIEIPKEQIDLDSINSLTGKEYKIKINAIGLDEIKDKIKELKALLDDKKNPLTDEQRKGVMSLLKGYTKLGDEAEYASRKSEKLEGIKNVAQSVESLAQGMGSLADESKGMAAGVAVVSLAASLSELVAGMVQKANSTTLTIWDWIAGVTAGTAAVISTAAQFKGMKFANGGVISGPTLGLMGEYPGASHNPEVVAPLDKLRGMLNSGGDTRVSGEFRVKGRELVAVIANETRISSKSGKRTNIKI